MNEDNAIINRYGFNSQGIDIVAQRLRDRELQHQQQLATIKQSGNPLRWFFGTYHAYSTKSLYGIIGLNLGKNKTSIDASADYVYGIQHAGKYADYVVVNVSSPNTPGLRNLQGKIELTNLLNNVITARNQISNSTIKSHHNNNKIPLFVKIAPDLTESDKRDIVDVIQDVGIDGIIISNTTIHRSDRLKSSHKNEIGGLSGAPLYDMSTRLVADIYNRTNGLIPIIGVGGISDVDTAYNKIRAGASLIQLYTAFAYQGPVVVSEIKKGLLKKLEQDGFNNIQDAVGVDAHKYT